jgi:hypothetical protein
MTQLIILMDAAQTQPAPLVQIRGGHGDVRSIQVTVAGQNGAAVAAVVKLFGYIDERYPVEVSTMTLSGTTSVSKVTTDNTPFIAYRAQIVSLSGAGALVSVVASV